MASIIEETEDAELRRMWSTVGELHRNFYEYSQIMLEKMTPRKTSITKVAEN